MAPAPNRKHIVVLGGGISGLAAAYRLTRLEPHLRVTLIEAAQRLGGKVVTEEVDGFVIEGGPDSFLAVKPRGVGLSAELGLGEALQGVTPRPKRAFILYDERLHELPEGLTGLVPTRLAPLARSSLLSPAGKARVALDYVLPARRNADDEPLGAFIRRRLGREAWERLVEPLMAGIYAADGDTLSLAATFPQLRDAELAHGGVIRGVLANRKSTPANASSPKSAFLTPAGGLGQLVSALERELRDAGVSMRTGVSAESISATGTAYDIALSCAETLTADAVIVATPAHVAATLFREIDRAVSDDLAAIPHASTAIVSLAYRGDEIPHPLDGHGYVVPRVAGSPILAATWSSRKWADRAPHGWELLRIFIGRAGDHEIDIASADDARLIALARAELETRLGVRAAPRLTRVQRWPRGMPQYVLGHPDRVQRIESALSRYPGLVLAANAFHGVGLPDCIASGERAAEAALSHVYANAAKMDDSALLLTPPAASWGKRLA